MAFQVIKVINANTLELKPKWVWDKESGNIVRISGYDAPENDNIKYASALMKLEQLISLKEVELMNPVRTVEGILLCEVHFNNKNIVELLTSSST